MERKQKEVTGWRHAEIKCRKALIRHAQGFVWLRMPVAQELGNVHRPGDCVPVSGGSICCARKIAGGITGLDVRQTLTYGQSPFVMIGAERSCRCEAVKKKLK